MINLIKKARQIIIDGLARYEHLRVDAENEYQAMSCGAFNPRFLAKIKQSTNSEATNSEEKSSVTLYWTSLVESLINKCKRMHKK